MEYTGEVYDFEKFSEQAQRVIKLFNQFIFARQLEGSAIADHICFRCASLKEYEHMRRILEQESSYLMQTVLSERRSAYLKLKVPFKTRLGDIWFVELSDQKPDGSQASGFQHIEIYPKGRSYNELVAKFQKSAAGNFAARPHHKTFDVGVTDSFQIRIEPEMLIEKIKAEEMK